MYTKDCELRAWFYRLLAGQAHGYTSELRVRYNPACMLISALVAIHTNKMQTKLAVAKPYSFLELMAHDFHLRIS